MQAKAIQHITGHSGAIYDVLVSSDHKIYTTSADKYVTRWDLKTGKQDPFAIRLEHSGYRIALSDESAILAIGNARGGIHVIDLNEKKEIRYLTQHQVAVFALTYNPFNKEFYSADGDGTFCVWDGTSFDYKLALPFNCGKIRSISLNQDGSKLLLSCQDGYVRLLETNFFNMLETWKAHPTGVNTSLFLEKGIFTGGKNAHISKWSQEDNQLLQNIPGHNYAVYDLISIHQENTLVSCSFDKTIKLWNTNDLSIIQRIERKDKGHKHAVNRLAKINEHEFISVSDDRVIIHWKVE